MKKLCILSVLLAMPFCQVYGERSAEPASSVEGAGLEDLQTETFHEIVINGESLRYKAVAGKLVLRDDQQEPTASFFYTAYIKDGVEDVAERPITFCFNGGPGASSVWLHLGLLGPRRIELPQQGSKLVDNEDTLLDVTDLVFIDPISTGYSRAVSEKEAKKFHGFEGDTKSIAEFIRLYVTRQHRWASPKFLAGESYGTLRAAGLVPYLEEEYRLYLDGLILVSTALNYQTIIDYYGGNDLPYLLSLPSFTAVAWHHQKLPPDLQKKALKAVLAEAEDFTVNDYSVALLKGDGLSAEERRGLASKLARYTGLSPEYIQRANFRVTVCSFCKELLRGENRTVGRFDGRVKGMDTAHCGQYIENDPSFDPLLGSFTAAFHQYVCSELNWEGDQAYKVLTREVRP